MKALILAGALALSATAAQAQYYGTGSNSNSHGTSGHFRSNGTYVQPYTSTNPDNTQRNNYGTSGNYNPHNGSFGHRTPRY